MATPEGKIKRWTDAMLKAEGVWYFSPQAGPYGRAGIPDRVGIIPGTGQFLGIECKADASSKPTALQSRCMTDIVSAGGMCFVVYDKETIEIVREYIVASRCAGQKSIGVSDDKPRRDLSCHSDSRGCQGELSSSSP